MRKWVERTVGWVKRVWRALTGSRRVKRTNLTHETPGPRADLQLEEISFKSEFPVVGGGVEFSGRLNDGSQLSRLTIIVLLVVVGCACVITLTVIGLPMWVSAASLFLPTALFGIFRPGKGQ